MNKILLPPYIFIRYIYIAFEKLRQFITHMYRKRGDRKYAISQGGEPGTSIYDCIHVHAVEALTLTCKWKDRRESFELRSSFLRGNGVERRRVRATPAEQQWARLATGGSITIAGSIPILCSV